MQSRGGPKRGKAGKERKERELGFVGLRNAYGLGHKRGNVSSAERLEGSRLAARQFCK
jgi:hypothetical protein